MSEFILRPYQVEAVNNTIKNYTSGKSKNQLIILPTASGKTPIISSICEKIVATGKKVIVLAHREELLDQAISEIYEIAPHLKVMKEQAGNTADMSADVIVASVQSIGTKTTEHRILKFKPERFGAILLDECHHALGSTTSNILKYFKRNQEILSVGVTATHIRTDGGCLSSIYDTIAFQRNIITMAREGYITPIVSRRIRSSTSLRGIRTTAGDYSIKELSETVNNKDRNKLILKTYLEYNISCVIYATDLDHASEINELFLENGIKSAYLAGDTDKKERRQILEDFQNQKIKVIVNFGILTEGWNCKFLSLIIMARPTQSALLLTQIVGRLFRLFPGKKSSTVVEIVDQHSEKTATTAYIFSFKKDYDCEGHTFLECCDVADEMIKKKDYFNPYDCDGWVDMHEHFERATHTNPLGLNIEEKQKRAFNGREVAESSGDRKFRYRFHRVSDDAYKLIHSVKEEGKKYCFYIKQDGIGEWILTIARKPLASQFDDKQEILKQFKRPTRDESLFCAEDFILNYFKSWDNLLNVDAPWRKRAEVEPCSDAQYKILVKNNLCNEPRNEINKALASDIIGAFFTTKTTSQYTNTRSRH